MRIAAVQRRTKAPSAAADERAALADLAQLTDIYRSVLEDYFARG